MTPQHRTTLCTFLLVLTCLALGLGCNAPSRGPYDAPSEAARDPLEAQRLTLAATRCMDGGSGAELGEAERLLRQALTADLYHGPAHNNLGVLYLKRDPPMLYEAAGEFEWARKLMPGHPEPRLNLALTLERAGRVEDALAAFRSALDVYPDHLASMQAITRLQVRTGMPDGQTDRMLTQIAMRGTTEEWRQWARRERGKVGR